MGALLGVGLIGAIFGLIVGVGLERIMANRYDR